MSIESTVAQNLQTPPNTSYTWDISHAFVTTYHPYCHSPSTLTEYLKHKLRLQRAKRLGCSPNAQVEQNVPLERNKSVVLFKSVLLPTSDPKSEFLCQSSFSCAEPADPLNTLYAWDISHTFAITYHPYCQSPSALTEYLKQKLCHQRAKHLCRSPSAQVKQNVPLKRNMLHILLYH